MSSYLNFYKKNGYLVKENLVNQKLINQINKVVNEVVSKEKRKRKKNDKNRSLQKKIKIEQLRRETR